MRALRTLALISAVAVLPIAAHAQTHVYHLNGTLADQNGGPSLVSDGGLLSASGYFFDNNKGLSLSNVFATDQSYSLVIHSRFNGILGAVGWQKIVDFWDRTSDHGMYSYFGSADFDPYTLTVGVDYQPGVFSTTILTRDASDLTLRIYVDGIHRYTITDGGGYSNFNPGIARFFEDDYVTNETEFGGGLVDYIATYNTVLSDEDAVNISNGLVVTPEPSTLVFLATGLFATIGVARRRTTKRR